MKNKTKKVDLMKGTDLYHEAFKSLWDVHNGVKITDICGVCLSVPKTPEEGDNAVFAFYKEICDAEAMKLARARNLTPRSPKFKSVIAEIDAKVDKAIAIFEKKFGHAPLRRGGYKAHAERVKLQFWG